MRPITERYSGPESRLVLFRGWNLGAIKEIYPHAELHSMINLHLQVGLDLNMSVFIL